MNKRPCECGCSYEDHVKQEFYDNRPLIMYCRNCGAKPPSWCYNYSEIDNLKYLEMKAAGEI